MLDSFRSHRTRCGKEEIRQDTKKSAIEVSADLGIVQIMHRISISEQIEPDKSEITNELIDQVEK